MVTIRYPDNLHNMSLADAQRAILTANQQALVRSRTNATVARLRREQREGANERRERLARERMNVINSMTQISGAGRLKLRRAPKRRNVKRHRVQY
jgi:hypothetical protein